MQNIHLQLLGHPATNSFIQYQILRRGVLIVILFITASRLISLISLHDMTYRNGFGVAQKSGELEEAKLD